jgi:hypothetical protein
MTPETEFKGLTSSCQRPERITPPSAASPPHSFRNSINFFRLMTGEHAHELRRKDVERHERIERDCRQRQFCGGQRGARYVVVRREPLRGAPRSETGRPFQWEFLTLDNRSTNLRATALQSLNTKIDAIACTGQNGRPHKGCKIGYRDFHQLSYFFGLITCCGSTRTQSAECKLSGARGLAPDDPGY